MIDIKALQKDFDLVSNALLKKGVQASTLESLKILSYEAKEKRQLMEKLQAEQKILSSS